MTSPQNTEVFNEAAVVDIRNSNLIGTFTVYLPQTQNHPDQRALDQSWVTELVKRIGSPGVLNQALHPISVILSDESCEEVLLDLLRKEGQNSAPKLPAGVQTLVFAGQHRLAMLSYLNLGDPNALWWHAKVYKKELETKHPAEFLTMMHESNSAQVVKLSGDVDLFRAVRKLRMLQKAGTISQQTFLNNRRVLLGGSDERINRAICNLTRNEELMDTVAKALMRVHIAKVFSAGSWMRITTGRLYMVAVGLLNEMITQVDLLTEGMSDVPAQVLSLRPQNCQVDKIKDYGSGRKKQAHPWDILPGGREGALKRVIMRPLTHVTHLNPLKNDPWTLPHIVLLPSCLGSKYIEDELKLMQIVTTHFLKMITTEEQFIQYNKSSPETVEDIADHPAGMIAQILSQKHTNDSNLHNYECKILHRLWANRAKLNEHLQLHTVPGVESSNEEDYQRLINESEPWWSVMRLLKIQRLRSRFRLNVPKVFGPACELGAAATDRNQGDPSSVVLVDHQPKRPAEEELSEKTEHKRSKQLVNRIPRDESTSSKGSHDASSALQPQFVAQSPLLTENQDQDKDGGECLDVDRQVVDQYPGESDPQEHGTVEARKGGDRRLTQVLQLLAEEADSMTRPESQGLTELLNQIVASKTNGNMEHLVKALVVKGKRVSLKMEKMDHTKYNSDEETPDN